MFQHIVHRGKNVVQLQQLLQNLDVIVIHVCNIYVISIVFA